MADGTVRTAPEQLAAWRKWRGFTQAQAAAEAGVQQGTWSEWENGRKTPRVEVANRLHRLGICPIWLWGEGDPPEGAVTPAAASPDLS